MKKTKIALMLAVCVGIVMTFSACGRPYSSYDLSDYIKVGEYKGLEVYDKRYKQRNQFRDQEQT